MLTFCRIDGPTATNCPVVLRDERVVWAEAVRGPLAIVSAPFTVVVVWEPIVPMVVFP